MDSKIKMDKINKKYVQNKNIAIDKADQIKSEYARKFLENLRNKRSDISYTSSIFD